MSQASNDRVVAIDLADGARRIISGSGEGEGPALDIPRSLIAAPGGEYLWLADRIRFHVLAIDRVTGERVLVSR